METTRPHHTHMRPWPNFLLVAWLVCLVSCRPGSEISAGHIRIGLGAGPETLDPHLAQGGPEDQVLINLFEGLTEYDPNTAQPTPALAKKWESNAGGTEFTFDLIEDARWSNGRPVTAHDFVYSWKRVLDPQTASPNASMLFLIRDAQRYHRGEVKDIGVEAIGNHKLKVTLERPASYFLQLTPHPAFRPVPKEAIEQYGRGWTEPEHLVTNGPYRLRAWNPNEKIIIEKGLTYHRADVRIELATFFLTEDYTALMNLYQTGSIDALVSGVLPSTSIPAFQGKDEFVTGPYLGSSFYLLNVHKPPFDKNQVRRAVSLSLNRDLICRQLLRAGQQPAHSLTPTDFGGRYPRPNFIRFDPSLAKDLMRAAGHADGRGIRFRITFNTSDLNRQVGEAVQGQLKETFPEIQVELVNLEWQVYLEAMRQKQFEMVRRYWTADFADPYSFLEMLLSDSSNNHSGWSHPAYDEKVRRANAAIDPSRRLKELAEAEAILLEDAPVVPLYEGVTYFLRRPSVEGWSPNVLDRHPLKFVRIRGK